MRDFARQHPLVILLAGVSIVLAILIALETAGVMSLASGPARAAAKPAPSAELKLVPVLAAVNPEQAYPESAARPLFTPTRRPAPPAAQAGSSMVRGQFTLQGVMGLGDKRTALLREKSSGRVHRVEKGQEVNGLTVSGVDEDKVTLAQGSEHEVITLQVQKGPAVAAMPAPAGTAAGPFGPAPGTASPTAAMVPTPAPPPPGMPATAATAPTGTPPAVNPAARSGFGPFPPGQQPPAAAQPAEAASQPLTPEELLARRRARRAQQEATPRGPQ